MTMNPRDKNTKKEIDDPNFSKLQISSSRHWTNSKNPRIVRVSRAFGGKDRHSKVCTIRGLRDRRIRLSIPTAVQLYDLQDRLGLGQPSKVVDWLLEATKDEIDKLPPLPMLPQFQDPAHPVSNTQQSLYNYNYNAPYPLSHFFQPYAAKELGFVNQAKEQENQENEGLGGFVAQNLFPLSNFHPSYPNMGYNFHFDPQSLSLSRFGEGFSFSDQTGQDPHHHQANGSLSMASSSNMPSVDISQFPSYNMAENIDMRSQNYNHFVTPTTLRLISSPMRSRTVHSPESDYGRESENRNRNS